MCIAGYCIHCGFKVIHPLSVTVTPISLAGRSSVTSGNQMISGFFIGGSDYAVRATMVEDPHDVVFVRLEHSHSFIDSFDNHSTTSGPASC